MIRGTFHGGDRGDPFRRRAAAGAGLGAAPDADPRPVPDRRHHASRRLDHRRAGAQRGDRAAAGPRTRPRGGGARCRTPACSPAIDHWAPRFVQAGIDYNDFVRTTARIERWEDWLDAWSRARRRARRAAPREAEAGGRRAPPARRGCAPRVAYHFGKFVWVLDAARARAVADRAVAALTTAHRLLDPAAERIEAPLDGADRRQPAPPAGVDRPPLVLLIPGLDSTKEEFFRLEERVPRAAGWRRCRMDGPGQGEAGYAAADPPRLRGRGRRPCSTRWPAATTSTSTGWARSASASAATTRRARRAFEPRIKAVAGISGAVQLRRDLGLAAAAHARDVHGKSGARDDEDGRERALAARPRRRARSGSTRPALFVTGRLDRLIPWEADRAPGARGARAATFVLLRGRQPRVREHPVHGAPAGRGLAARAARVTRVRSGARCRAREDERLLRGAGALPRRHRPARPAARRRSCAARTPARASPRIRGPHRGAPPPRCTPARFRSSRWRAPSSPTRRTLCSPATRSATPARPVALVVADSPALAADLAEQVEVDYEPLAAVVGPAATPPSGSCGGAEAAGSGRRSRAPRTSCARAHVIPRLVAAPIEPRGVIARWRRRSA